MPDTMKDLVNALQRQGTRTFTVKSANPFMESLKELWADPAKKNILMKGLAGAGAGAVGLGGIRALRKTDDDKAEKARGVVSSALMGALLGGTAGAGWGFTEYAAQPSIPSAGDMPQEPNIIQTHPLTTAGTAAGTIKAIKGMHKRWPRPDKGQLKVLDDAINEAQLNLAKAKGGVTPAAAGTVSDVLDAAGKPTMMGAGTQKQMIDQAQAALDAARNARAGAYKSVVKGVPKATRAGRFVRVGGQLLWIPAFAAAGYGADRLAGFPGARQQYYEDLQTYRDALQKALRLANKGDHQQATNLIAEVTRKLTEGGYE